MGGVAEVVLAAVDCGVCDVAAGAAPCVFPEAVEGVAAVWLVLTGDGALPGCGVLPEAVGCAEVAGVAIPGAGDVPAGEPGLAVVVEGEGAGCGVAGGVARPLAITRA